MNTPRTLKRMLAGAVLSAGVTMAGFGAATGTAHADAWAEGPHQWCPGQPLPQADIQWDMGACHTWYLLVGGPKGNVGGRWNTIWDGPNPPAPIRKPPGNCGLFFCPEPPGS
ncbi:hypothetical protein BST11_13635 [Mycobacterium alsense]|uniref:Secreted protein n=1 Tax=Mycobacterium alsense TaxID=324058 RepID=A0AA41XHA5_9MYCO|nr:hypothetical protein [Mycobacterium alsense]MCV7377071.1 hypothetical protein [Mycobacterium alsense]OQZ90280.1 hypothetical protein BST11_13635 [Mycobacterium alsense]